MSRRKSSILLPFNSTASKADNQTGNVSRVRNRKTPAKRRRTQVEVSEPGLDENNLEFYDDLKQKMWSIYRVADLDKFNYQNPGTFPRYGRILSRYLVHSFTQPVTLQAKFLEKPDLKGFESENTPVHIKVEDIQLNNPRLVYEGILFSAHDSGDSKIEGATHLPVLLARGPITVRNKVHECLTAVFSSAIHEVSFPPEEMQWMIAAWSGFLNESQKNKEVNFLYGLPAKADTIQCQYSVNFIKDLWRCIHDQDSLIVELNEVKKFHDVLVRHTYKILGLNLAAIPLIMYRTPDFELHATGKVKVKTVEFVPRILHFIADLCETQNRTDKSDS